MVIEQNFSNSFTNKKYYQPPKLIKQDHMARVTRKTGGLADSNHPGKKTHLTPSAAGPSGETGSGSGSLFDDPFDD